MQRLEMSALVPNLTSNLSSLYIKSNNSMFVSDRQLQNKSYTSSQNENDFYSLPVTNRYILKEIGVGSVGLEEWARRLLDTGWQRELDLGIVHRFDKGSASVDSGNRLHTDDLDAMSSGAVTGSHVAIALGDGSNDGHVTIFAVHVVGSRPGVITEPDTEVLDLQGLLLLDLLDTDDFTSGLLELPQLTQKVPKSGEKIRLV